jgi:serine phosphatase RsbU (regulator of sigma subunit)
MRIGNAGHIPPYLNGVAMEIEGSLPLGIVAGVEFPVQTVQTEPGDYLTLMTDGVLEARNADGELLGFERLGEISSMSAEQMARVAMRFGQDDDITVVSVSVREAV